MSEFRPHHVTLEASHVAGNGGRGRFFLLPGSDARARQLGERFEDLRVVPSPRQHNAYLGRLALAEGYLDVGAVSTGMGTPSLDIIATELILLGARRLLRVGTAGSMQPGRIGPGDLVVATAAVRDEGSSRAYAPVEVPAVAHPDWVAALVQGARDCGVAERTFAGSVHTKDSLFGREFGYGPLAEEHHRYRETLTSLGVLASEMECAQLFTLAAVHGRNVAPVAAVSASAEIVKCGALLAVIGGETPFASSEEARAAEQRAVEVALAGLAALWRAERS